MSLAEIRCRPSLPGADLEYRLLPPRRVVSDLELHRADGCLELDPEPVAVDERRIRINVALGLLVGDGRRRVLVGEEEWPADVVLEQPRVHALVVAAPLGELEAGEAAVAAEGEGLLERQA